MNPTPDIRWKQRLTNLDRAYLLLRDALANGPAALNQLEREGVTQRFEYCFELAWKTTKDYMGANGVVFAVVTPRQVVKDAFATKTIADGQVWIAMLDHRNVLSYTYNSAVFEQAVESIHQCYLIRNRTSAWLPVQGSGAVKGAPFDYHLRRKHRGLSPPVPPRCGYLS